MEDQLPATTEPLPEFPDTDELLVNLINIANMANAEIGITLHMPGGLISGLLVSSASYFEGLATGMEQATGGSNLASMLKESYSKTSAALRAKDEDQESVARHSGVAREFIHLKNARYCDAAGNLAPAQGGVWWRGRLAAVSGFSLGSFARGL